MHPLNRGTFDTSIPTYRARTGFLVVEFLLQWRWGASSSVLSQQISGDDGSGPGRLSPREREALHWVREHKENSEIAISLGISPHPVKTTSKTLSSR